MAKSIFFSFVFCLLPGIELVGVLLSVADAVAVCLVIGSGFSLSSCLLVKDFFSVFFNATSSCVFGPLDELGPLCLVWPF